MLAISNRRTAGPYPSRSADPSRSWIFELPLLIDPPNQDSRPDGEVSRKGPLPGAITKFLRAGRPLVKEYGHDRSLDFLGPPSLRGLPEVGEFPTGSHQARLPPGRRRDGDRKGVRA